MKEPKFRYETRTAIEALAQELKLQYAEHMQDWPYEVSNPADVEKYIEHYKLTSDEDKRFVLMKIIIQAVNDQTDKNNFLKYWDRIKEILSKDFAIHECTIFYWCIFDSDYIGAWVITPGMREIWNSHSVRERGNHTNNV